jgi:protein SCO1/2
VKRRLLSALLAALLAAPAAAQAPSERVGLDQRLNEQVPLELTFRDEQGRSVTLGDCLGGKPAVLVLAYYRCPRLCNLVLNGLLDALRAVPFDAGEQYQVIVVSIDPRETPQLAAAKKAAHVEAYGRPGTEAGWHFLTGEQPAIDRLAEAVGFRYFYDADKEQFAHASGVMVLTPGGKLARYFYGVRFPARDLRLSLVEAASGRIGSPVELLLLLCYQYDAASGRYTVAIMNFVRLGGVLTVLALGAWVVRALRRERGTPKGVASRAGAFVPQNGEAVNHV